MTNYIHQTAYSLIELLIVIAILGALFCASMLLFSSFNYTQHATIAMHQLQQAIFYARSLALRYQQKVTLCPSYNKYGCGGGWQHGVLVLPANGEARFFETYAGAQASLLLMQSGYSNNSITIQADGLSHSNGHFTYRSLNTTAYPEFKLYFNKGLRTYVSTS